MKKDLRHYISERTKIEQLDNSDLKTNILFELFYSGNMYLSNHTTFIDKEADNIDFRYKEYNLSRNIIKMCFWNSKKGNEFWNKIRKELNCQLSDYNFK